MTQLNTYLGDRREELRHRGRGGEGQEGEERRSGRHDERAWGRRGGEGEPGLRHRRQRHPLQGDLVREGGRVTSAGAGAALLGYFACRWTRGEYTTYL